jgi:hypothetical protein
MKHLILEALHDPDVWLCLGGACLVLFLELRAYGFLSKPLWYRRWKRHRAWSQTPVTPNEPFVEFTGAGR